MYMYKRNKNTFITQLDAHQNNTRLIFLLLKLINNSQRKFKRNQYLITIFQKMRGRLQPNFPKFNIDFLSLRSKFKHRIRIIMLFYNSPPSINFCLINIECLHFVHCRWRKRDDWPAGWANISIITMRVTGPSTLLLYLVK